MTALEVRAENNRDIGQFITKQSV